MPAPDPRTVGRARRAVAALFFVNGGLYANVALRYPDLITDLGLSKTAFGTAVAAYGLGALVLGLLAPALVVRWGSARVAAASTAVTAANLVLIGVAPSWAALATALLVAGALDAVADLSINSHALRVERLHGRSILSSLHAVWSLGAVAGAATGTAAAELEVPLLWHLAGAGLVLGALGGVAARSLLPGPDDAVAVVEGATGTAWWSRGRTAGVLLALGAVAATGQVMEDSGAQWGAVYLRGEVGATATVAGSAFVALQGAQVVGRLLGDRAVTRFGDRAVARSGAALAGGAMAAALALPSPAGTVLAFGAVGLGIGTLIPAGMRAADALPGLPRGVGLAAVGTVLRVSVLTVPPLIGVVADASSLRVGLLAIPVVAVVVLLLASVLPARRAGGA